MTHKRLWIALTVGIWIVAVATWRPRCERTWLRYGLDLASCPDGELRQTGELNASSVSRSAQGLVAVRAIAHYTPGDADGDRQAELPRLADLALSLEGGDKVSRPIAVLGWPMRGVARVQLPDVPDGDYQLRARFSTALGPGEVTAPLALYAPARIHVITDRPLYEPGNTMRFRAVVVRAKDLAPIEHRPGTWLVTNPAHEVVLEEAAASGPWGVVAGSFPLDRAAASGAWTVAWRSAGATDEVAVTVQPFTLPRFRIDALADRAFYRPGDHPVVKGAVIYSSGAPVAGARLELAWSVDGAWPPPAAWLAGALPVRGEAGANGRFELALPEVPADLQGRATLTAQIAARDAAGDRVAGAVKVLLSADGIAVSAVTELGDGLVEQFNNRLYLRVTTPDDRVVANQAIQVTRAWLPGDPGLTAQLDEDGVASLQLDPGAPVNLVIPPAPYRPPVPPPAVRRGEVAELIAGQGATLADQLAFDRWLPGLAPCANQVETGGAEIKLGLRVDRGGGVIAAAGPSALERCAVAAIQRERLPAGPDRLYALGLAFTAPALPRLVQDFASAQPVPDGLAEVVAARARDARSCLPNTAGGLASVLTWRARAGERAVELTGWVGAPSPAVACVAPRLTGRIALAAAATSDAVGLVRFGVEPYAVPGAARPQATTMLGYELAVTLATGNSDARAIVRIAPGAVPPLRLRVTPVLAKPGDTLTAELIRGPAFTGALPEELATACFGKDGKAKLVDHRATLRVPDRAEGWCTFAIGPLRAAAYVAPAAQLALSVVPRQDRYKPGERATLDVRTTVGGAGQPAAVGLFGVDDRLGQLVPLPGPDALARLAPTPTTERPAFGVLDGQALVLGRIRGANAAAATVLRVSAVPAPAELDAVASAHGQTAFDPGIELADRFYVVLAELHAQTRAWEAAPGTAKMTPATLAGLWQRALDACAARGQRVDDAYGRRLRLARLPADLLALTDPRAVVVAATRLPEDVENWPAWVAREQP